MVKPVDSPKTEVRTLAAPYIFADALTDDDLGVARADSHVTCVPLYLRYG